MTAISFFCDEFTITPSVKIKLVMNILRTMIALHLKGKLLDNVAENMSTRLNQRQRMN